MSSAFLLLFLRSSSSSSTSPSASSTSSAIGRTNSRRFVLISSPLYSSSRSLVVSMYLSFLSQNLNRKWNRNDNYNTSRQVEDRHTLLEMKAKASEWSDLARTTGTMSRYTLKLIHCTNVFALADEIVNAPLFCNASSRSPSSFAFVRSRNSLSRFSNRTLVQHFPIDSIFFPYEKINSTVEE